MHHDPLQSKPFSGRPELAHDFQELHRLQAEWWPDVEQNAVPGQALVSRQAGLVEADTIECFHQHAFKVGDLDDAARIVPHWCHIAHLGESE